MNAHLQILVTAIFILLTGNLSVGTHISGVVTYAQVNGTGDLTVPLTYLGRFGVAANNDLYVFGTVQPRYKFIRLRSRMILVLIPQELADHLVESYFNSHSCDTVIKTVLNGSISVDDSRCENGTKDYIRNFPCSSASSCNQPPNLPIIAGNDFTYHVEKSPETEYYYLFMLSCDRNYTESCEWSQTDNSTLIYDISLVNSKPGNVTIDPFVYQFPFDLEGILLIHLLFSIGYLILFSIHILIHCGLCKWPCSTRELGCRMHHLPALFTASLLFDFLHVIFAMLHYSVYAGDGVGAVWSRYMGEVASQLSDWLLILVLLLIGKGWMITDSALRNKKLTFGVWGAYVLFFFIYFIWTVLQEQVFPLSISTNHTFQSWPGGFYLTYRLVLLAYILYQMRHIYLMENRPEKLKLYFTLAILYIVWFCYLPLVVFVSALMNPLLRFRVVLMFMLVFDFLANMGMVVLFVPHWAKLIFQFDSHLNALQESTRAHGTSYKRLTTIYGSSDTHARSRNIV